MDLLDQVTSLIQRNLAQDKTAGTMSSDAEVASLLEIIATTLLLNPRATLYLAFLARNALIKVANDEIATIDQLIAAINDLSNQSLLIQDSSALERAKNALINVEDQKRIQSSNNSLKLFTSSIDEFLNKQLSKNVKKSGSLELARPAEEAKATIPGLVSGLKSNHSDLLDRLYSLTTGITNFLNSPTSSLIGISTATRVRQDLQSIIDDINATGLVASSQETAIKLFAAKAALQLLGSTASISPIVLSDNIPLGYHLSATSTAKASTVSTTGPYVLPTSATLQINATSSSFPLSTFDLHNRAHVVSDVVSYPITVPSNSYLFLRLHTQVTTGFSPPVDPLYQGYYTNSSSILGSNWLLGSDGTYFKTIKIPIASGNIASVITAIQTALGSSGSASEFPKPGTGRLIIYLDPVFDSVQVITTKSDISQIVVPNTGLASLSTATQSLPTTALTGTALQIDLSTDGGLTYPTSAIHNFTGEFSNIDGIAADLNSDGAFSPSLTAIDNSPKLTIISNTVGVNISIRVSGLSTAIGTGKLNYSPGQTAFGSIITVYTVSTFSNSANALLGFRSGISGNNISTPLSTILISLNSLYSDITASQSSDISGNPIIFVQSVASTPSTQLSISGNASSTLGISGIFKAQSNKISLSGTVNGVSINPFNPLPLIDIQDEVVSSTGISNIIGLTSQDISLSSPIATINESITINSFLYKTWSILDSSLRAFVTIWLGGQFSKDLSSIDRAVAPLNGSSTLAQRGDAISALNSLKTSINSLITSISADFPSNATLEKDVINNIIQALSDRKLDRAVDFLLKCKIQEIFTMDYQTASFAGFLLKSSSDIVRTDLVFPNLAKDEGNAPISTSTRIPNVP